MNSPGDSPSLDERLRCNLAALEDIARESLERGSSLLQGPDAERSIVELGQGVLVLTLIESVRRPLEKQAIQLIESGLDSLTEEQIERLCEPFLKLEQKMAEIRLVFGLEEEDLNLNLGTLEDLS